MLGVLSNTFFEVKLGVPPPPPPHFQRVREFDPRKVSPKRAKNGPKGLEMDLSAKNNEYK